MGKTGVGVAGCGWMGKALIQRAMEHENVEIRGLYNPNREESLEALASLGLPAGLWSPDYRTLLDDPAIEAIIVASPNRFHGEQSLRALRAGRHVFCEKPCATSFHEFREQVQISRAHPELVTFVDYILHFDHMERRLCRMVADGLLGTVTQIQVNYRHPVNTTDQKAWKLRREIVGDAIGMGITHALWVMLAVMSAQARPVKVYATCKQASVRPFEVPPVWSILVGFDNGATGVCLGNIDDCNGYDAYHHVFGTDGAFVFDSQTDHTHKVRYWSGQETGRRWVYPLDPQRCEREGVAELAWPAGTSTPDSGDVIHHQTAACVNHFIECVRTGRPSPLSFGNSAPVAELGWAARMSAAMQREVVLPLDWDEADGFFPRHNEVDPAPVRR